MKNENLKPAGEIVSSTEPRQGMQFFKFEKAIPFLCQHCNREKKAKNLAVIDDDWSKILCNGCYGYTLSQLEGKH